LQVSDIHDIYLKHCHDVTIDSRASKKGAMFFALPGKNSHGNKFASSALDNGAAYAVVDDIECKKDERYIVVENVFTTLQELAVLHRNNFDIPFIGITGSMGKTTTKELISAALSKSYSVLATECNLNNHLGVPLTLLKCSNKHDIAVIEMGANRLADIQMLCNIAKPTHGLITNIASVHLEGFGSYENIIKGKSELYDYLEHSNGVIFANEKNELLHSLVKDRKGVVYYGDALKLRFADPYISYETEQKEIIKTNIIGSHNFANILAAFSIAKFFKVPDYLFHSAIAAYVSQNNRMQIIRKGSSTILLDAYNSNYESVIAAINSLDQISDPDKVLILGDMLELGSESLISHEKVINRTRIKNYSKVLLIGENMYKLRHLNPNALYFKDKIELEAYINTTSFYKSAILIKASRKLSLETIISSLLC
jgi:UDP-N-acetylmuramoyl-tripeptide--D-alanyl-D-alanine ligase